MQSAFASKRGIRVLFLLCALLGTGLGTPAGAEEAARDYAAETLSGDWGGARTQWSKRGLDVDLAYKLDLMHSRGGNDDAEAAMGNLDVMLRADLDKLLGWRHSVAYLQLIHDHGSKLNNHVGSLMGVSNIEVPVNTGKVFHAWLQRNFLDDRLGLLVGLYPVDSEFSVMESAGLFVHPALGATADFALTRGPSIFNTSALGIRARWDGADRDYYAMAALLDGLPGDPADPRGTHIRFDSGDGAFAIVEFGLTPAEFGHTFEPTDPSSAHTQPAEIREHERTEARGKYALGLWAYSEKSDDLIDVDAAGNPVRRASRGGYLLAERSLCYNPAAADCRLAGFARISLTDGDSTPVRRAVNLGLTLRAPVDSRPEDVAGIAFSRAYLSDKYRAAAGGLATAEDAVELTYRAQLRPWLWLQPLIEYVRRPGGDAAVDDATVIGLRIELNL